MKKRTTRVSDILEFKGPSVMTIKSTETVATLSRRLQQEQIGAMVVSDDGESVAGIISERDLAYGISLYRSEIHALPVSSLMTRKVITCTPHDTLSSVAKLMNERHIRHLPVTDGEKLVGVISMRDIVIQRLDDMQRTARLMGNFVMAGQ